MLSKIKTLHLEPTNLCTLKCAGCARTQFIQQWPKHWQNHNIDSNALLKFIDIDLKDVEILFCGNYGDPIYYPDLILLVQQFKNRGATIRIVTNGSYKSADWWNELTSLLTEQDKLVFSIDGLPENFTQYRKNADWDSILQGITVATKSKCTTEWKFIPFNYNETNIEQAGNLSNSLGIDRFVLDHSDRFDSNTNHLIPSDSLLGNRWSNQQQFKQGEVNQVDPRCYKGTEHFISAQGYYSSCCYAADHRFYYKTEFGRNRQQYKIDQTTLTEILSRPSVVEFFRNVETQPVCQYNCPGKKL